MIPRFKTEGIYLFGLDHPLNHDLAEVGEHVVVQMLPQRKVGVHGGVNGATTAGNTTNHLPHTQQWVDVCHRDVLHLLVQFLDQLIPIFQANLENLAVLDL